MKRLKLSIAIVALTLTVACANALVNSTRGESVVVRSVHAVVVAENAAYDAKAYDRSTHRSYVVALQKIVAAEAALNDALMSWDRAGGAEMPQIVNDAVTTLQVVLAELEPLVGEHPVLADLIQKISAAVDILLKVA